ncbi:unnamed protein product [Cylindrotheca closterium]|uniref:RING-type domain-containing protein n=1 Tax=Cylindrotheca closterium TaxID=2856 RepID=A0AAD2FU05_9STRA|nr:unnamed protein product [Cylindrotheca closterium]
MGNQSSSEGRTFGRSGNSLGLSRSELEKRCQPSGLYNNCKWDDKAIRKLVGDGKLASRQKGCEDRTMNANQECPICFLYYKETNVTKCCGANICTECYLQVKPQKEKTASCPFCNAPKVTVTVARKLTEDQLAEQKKEEERVTEARKRSQSVGTASEGSDFGSSLQEFSRARSESFNSSFASNATNTENINPMGSLAMTPEERQRLEAEMKAQLSHPLTMRVEAEAAERRMENERAYSRSTSSANRNSRFRRRRGRGGRDWNQIVDAFERGGNGQIQSLDDLVVLEAAILLSMGEEARSSSGGADGFDPARHARNGFPLVRNYFNNREETAESSSSSSSYPGSSRQQVPPNRNTALDTAAMLMRGISEEDQMAMAIAASLQDQNGTEEGDEEGDEDDVAEDIELDGQEGEECGSEEEDDISEVAEGEEGGEDYSDEEDDNYPNDASTDDEDRAYGGDAEVSNVEDDTDDAERLSAVESEDDDGDDEEDNDAAEPLSAVVSGNDNDEGNNDDPVPNDDESSDADILES